MSKKYLSSKIVWLNCQEIKIQNVIKIKYFFSFVITLIPLYLN